MIDDPAPPGRAEDGLVPSPSSDMSGREKYILGIVRQHEDYGMIERGRLGITFNCDEFGQFSVKDTKTGECILLGWEGTMFEMGEHLRKALAFFADDQRFLPQATS